MRAATTIGERVRYERRGRVGVLWLDRPAKRNALDREMVESLGRFFEAPPDGVRSAVLTTTGEHFSAGLDLSEIEDNTVLEGIVHSQSWHRPFAAIERGSIPVVSALRGAVIGGGLELALVTHIRVAEASTYYALPEGSRGIFVGGGASVRLPRIIGVHRMADMMLTGRVLTAAEGHDIGISQYLVEDGSGLDRALELAERIADNAAATNFAVMHALPRIAEMSPADGLFFESLTAAISQDTVEAKQLLKEFLDGRADKIAGSTEG